MSDPHADNYCVVCNRSPQVGMRMHPVNTLENGCVCGKCRSLGAQHVPWSETDG